MNFRAALLKDGGKPMGPSLAEKKKAEERAREQKHKDAMVRKTVRERQKKAATLKYFITQYAEELDAKDEAGGRSGRRLANIKRHSFWTDPMDQKSVLYWTDNLIKLDKLEKRLGMAYERRLEERLEKFKKEHNGMTPREVEEQAMFGYTDDECLFHKLDDFSDFGTDSGSHF